MSNRRIKRILIRQVDAIYTRSKSVTKKWGEDKIPLNAFEKVIESAKVSAQGEELLKNLVDQFNSTCDTMYKLAQENADSLGNKYVTLVFIKLMVDETKKAFNEGFNNG